MTWHPRSGNLALFAALLLTACTEHRTPEVALEEADARLQAGDPTGAVSILDAAAREAPDDPRLRIAAARADLAAGNAAAAQGSLARAVKLGASQDEVAAYMAQALLAQGQPHRVLELVGDVSRWPESRQWLLALSKSEATLALPNYNRRDLTKSFVEVFRLRAMAQQHGAIADLPWFDRRVADLREKHEAVAAGHQHFACHREQPTLLSSPTEPKQENRRVLRWARASHCAVRVTPRASRGTTTSSR